MQLRFVASPYPVFSNVSCLFCEILGGQRPTAEYGILTAGSFTIYYYKWFDFIFQTHRKGPRTVNCMSKILMDAWCASFFPLEKQNVLLRDDTWMQLELIHYIGPSIMSCNQTVFGIWVVYMAYFLKVTCDTYLCVSMIKGSLRRCHC